MSICCVSIRQQSAAVYLVRVRVRARVGVRVGVRVGFRVGVEVGVGVGVRSLGRRVLAAQLGHVEGVLQRRLHLAQLGAVLEGRPSG